MSNRINPNNPQVQDEILASIKNIDEKKINKEIVAELREETKSLIDHLRQLKNEISEVTQKYDLQ